MTKWPICFLKLPDQENVMSHLLHLFDFSPLCVFKNLVFKDAVTLVTIAWLFSTVHFQMCPQMTCIKGYIVVLVAFVWLFTIMGFQMCLQIACMRGCKVTLIAVVFVLEAPLCNIFFKGPRDIAQYLGFLYDTQTIFAIFTIWLKMRVNCRKCNIRVKFVKSPYNTYKIILHMHKKCTKCINSCCYMSYHKK